MAFSMCNRTAIYSWATNKYGQDNGDCSSRNGTASLRDAKSLSAHCRFLLDQVGETGEKTLTAFLGDETSTVSSSSLVSSRPTESGDVGEFAFQDVSASGLATGAKLGIGVGVPVAVLLFLVAGFLLLKRRRRVDAELRGKDDVPEYVPPRDEAQGNQTRAHDLPEVQTSPRP